MSEWNALYYITSGANDRDACRSAGVSYGLFFLSIGADEAFRTAYQNAKSVRGDVLALRAKSPPR